MARDDGWNSPRGRHHSSLEASAIDFGRALRAFAESETQEHAERLDRMLRALAYSAAIFARKQGVACEDGDPTPWLQRAILSASFPAAWAGRLPCTFQADGERCSLSAGHRGDHIVKP